MKKQEESQRKRIDMRLRERGEVSRNECLDKRPRITRLSAIIKDMRIAGWDIIAYWTDKKVDYIYKLITAPKKSEEKIKTLYN